MDGAPDSEIPWAAQNDPGPLLGRVADVLTNATDDERRTERDAVIRRMRLFASACCRSVWEALTNDARSAVAVVERFAIGTATLTDIRAIALPAHFPQVTAYQHAAAAVRDAVATCTAIARQRMNADSASRNAAKALATQAAGRAPFVENPGWHSAWTTAFLAHRAEQASILRDIFPPPGAAIAFDPEWRTTTVVELAWSMDAKGDYAAVPILADALEDAGCTSALILNQCRADGPHVRGNWVIELILNDGRE